MDDKTIKRKTFLINLAYILAIGGIVYILFKYAISYVMPFVVAFCIVSLINPLIKGIKNKFPNRQKIVSVIAILLLYLIVGTLIFFLVFNILLQLRDLAVLVADDYYPNAIKPTLTELWNVISTTFDELPKDWQNIANEVQSKVMNSLQQFVVGIAPRLMSLISSFTGGIPRFLIAFVFTVMLSFFVGMQYDDIIKLFKFQLSQKALTILTDLKVIVGRSAFNYLRALFSLMIITFIELLIGFTILGVDNAFLIALGICLLDALPVFGTGTILIPWVIIELFQGDYRLAAGIAIIYGVVTAVRNIIEPKVVGDKLGMNPIISIVAIYFGFKVFGVFGMIFMPIVAHIIIELNRRGTIHLFKLPENKEAPVKITAKK